MSEHDQTAFRRHRSKQEYDVVVYPKHILYDKNLSGNARVLLMTMIDLGHIRREDGKPWDFYHYDLIKRTGFSKHHLSSAIENLIACGYVKRTRLKIEGRWANYQYEYCAFPDFLEENSNNFSRDRKNGSRFSEAEILPYTKTNKDCSSLIDIKKGNEGDGSALPHSIEKKEKAKAPDKKQPKKIKPLNEDQQAAVAWLEFQQINASYDTITYWACNYSLQKIKDAVGALNIAIANGAKIRNAAGFIRSTLDGKMMPITQDVENNRMYAQNVASHFKIQDWKFHQKYMIDESIKHEIPFTVTRDTFKKMIDNLLTQKGL